MEGRDGAALHLETTDLTAEDYLRRRGPVWTGRRVTMFTNAYRDRDDLPRTHPEFDTLAVVELPADEASSPAVPPSPGDGVLADHRFLRTSRPGQGSLTDEPTTGLQLVLISPREVGGEAALRDWADFVHIRHIAEAAVPGFRMITPYVNVAAPDSGSSSPRFLHFYEMHTDDPEAAFQEMTPRVAERLGGPDNEAFREWAWHPQLRIDYVNTFRRVG